MQTFALRQAWRRFWLSLSVMSALSAFSLWRVDRTVWRAPADRQYLFPADTWLGYVEHCWLNDALYAFGMVGILYVLYTAKERLTAGPAQPATLTEELWSDHQQRSKLMIGTGVVIILIWAWLEEIAGLVPGYVFDKWDVQAIYLGFILGFCVIHRLSYPVFAARPRFMSGPLRPNRHLDDAQRLLYAAFLWSYTWLTDPVTMGDRWSHLGEVSALVLGVVYLLEVSRRPQPPRAHLRLAAHAP